VPTLPRKVREDIRLTPSELEEINKRLPIMPKERHGVKVLDGGKRVGAI
jgi:hypothetical protein